MSFLCEKFKRAAKLIYNELQNDDEDKQDGGKN